MNSGENSRDGILAFHEQERIKATLIVCTEAEKDVFGNFWRHPKVTDARSPRLLKLTQLERIKPTRINLIKQIPHQYLNEKQLQKQISADML
ncbi:hypothetical protein [Vibrio mangrovi]|uniref:Uncharacterized protein n=1 Tax=Vibrio mangrovi TaxID=474394 RepID=A0ABU4I7H5_9VIBR|nr:hypothetical protein [Vibrio mangrovi]MDW6003542.1 hypothetical protein [Vibrio mangrovi]